MQNTEGEPIRTGSSAAAPAALSSLAGTTLYGKIQGFVPKLSAIDIYFITSCRKPASLYAHGSRIWQHTYSHFIAICIRKYNRYKELHAHEQALFEEPTGGTDSHRIERSRSRRTHEIPSSPAGAILNGKIQGAISQS